LTSGRLPKLEASLYFSSLKIIQTKTDYFFNELLSYFHPHPALPLEGEGLGGGECVSGYNPKAKCESHLLKCYEPGNT